DAHREHFADGVALPGDLERLTVETAAAARIARHLHVRQEVHLDRLLALAVTGGASSSGAVEREPAGPPAAQLRLRGLGEEAANRVPEADIGGGTGSRRLADRRLVDFQHPVDPFPARQAAEADERGRRLALVAGGHQCREVAQQDVAGQRRLARAGYAGDHAEPTERRSEERRGGKEAEV